MFKDGSEHDYCGWNWTSSNRRGEEVLMFIDQSTLFCHDPTPEGWEERLDEDLDAEWREDEKLAEVDAAICRETAEELPSDDEFEKKYSGFMA